MDPAGLGKISGKREPGGGFLVLYALQQGIVGAVSDLNAVPCVIVEPDNGFGDGPGVGIVEFLPGGEQPFPVIQVSKLFLYIIGFAVTQIKGAWCSTDTDVCDLQPGKDVLDDFQSNKCGAADLSRIFLVLHNQLKNVFLYFGNGIAQLLIACIAVLLD